MKAENQRKGFTLIELMLVVAIISLLSSAFFYSTTEARQKAEDVHMAQEAGQVTRAVEMYRQDKGSVPNRSGVVGQVYMETTPEYLANMEELVASGYMSAIPTSPRGANYAYGFTTDGNAVFVVNTIKSGPRCRVIDGSGGSERSCDGILPPEDSGEENPPEENSPYSLTIGYYERMTLEPRQEYTLTYSGSGSEVTFEVDGQGVVQTWIAGDSFASMSYGGDWNCDQSYCYNPTVGFFEFRNYDPETLTLKVYYSPAE